MTHGNHQDIPQFFFSTSITLPTLSHPEDLPITSACRAPHRHVDQSDAWPLGTVMPFHRPTSSACEILFDSDGRFSLVSSHRSRVIQRSTGHDSISPRFEPLNARMATAVGPMARIMQGNFLVCLNAPGASVLGFVRDHPVADALSWEMLWLSPRMSMYCGSCAVSIQLTTERVDSRCLHVKIVLS